ncbi:MAG TPA: (d)CMP kinase [Gemmatimonadaceae bacterium]|nr:(d)CMP kinase [Gemmatimonadaceae bacterium]
MSERHIVIAIDGPAASGKSSTAQWVARRLGFFHVDSGSLYRAATVLLIQRQIDPELWTDDQVLEGAPRIAFVPAEATFVPLIDGAHVDEALRGSVVTQNVWRVAQMQRVRDWVNDQVRLAAQGRNVVVDGRDIGTTVFPDADLKIFLIADPWERARRRLVQRLGRGPSDDEIADETDRITRRDAYDATQSARASDSVLIDTTYLTQEDQVDRIVALAHAAARRDAQPE